MTDLVTLHEYKTYKGINSTTKDNILSQLITSTSKFISNYCSRNFSSATYTEYKDCNNSLVYLNNFPVTSVTSVKTSTDGGVTQTALVENTDYFVDLESDSIVSAYDYFAYSVITHKSLEIVYTAGYSNIPDDLKLCAMDLVEYYADNQYIKSQQLMGSSVTYIVDTLPGHIKRTLDLYRVL